MTTYEAEKLANQIQKLADKIRQMEQQIIVSLRQGDHGQAAKLDMATIKHRINLGFLLQKLHK